MDFLCDDFLYIHSRGRNSKGVKGSRPRRIYEQEKVSRNINGRCVELLRE